MLWDNTFEMAVPGYRPRFATTLAVRRTDGARMFAEWLQVAQSHFLGVLHLDEMQNFFKLPTLAQRRQKKAGRADGAIELSLVEDQLLKSVLTLVNRGQIPLVLSGTPDGANALITHRVSNAQRLATGAGAHEITAFPSVSDPRFRGLMDFLAPYQYLQKRLVVDDKVRALILELTGGIARLIVALWISAQRVALDRKDDTLRVDDFRRAASTYMAPVAPAVAALRSGDPRKLSRYEDLIPLDTSAWSGFWGQTSPPK